MKIIFLDIDGVMVTGSYQKPSTFYNGNQFNPTCVTNLMHIMKATGASIVVTSTWRSVGFDRMKQILAVNGIETGLSGLTPTIVNGSREDEITQYIAESKLDPAHTVEQFVIIDDNHEMRRLASHLVRTDWFTGLDEKATEQAIKVLSKPLQV